MSRSGAAAFAAVELRVRRLLDGRLQGDHLGVRIGPGSEAEEVVRYRSGEDDVRRIDWNVTARSQELHVWRSRAEHELQTWVLLDDTASMAFGTDELEKRDLALMVTAALGVLTDGPGNRLGLARLHDGGVHWSVPLPGRQAGRRALRAGTGEVGPRRVTPAGDLAAALRELHARRRHRGLRVVVSDFIEPDGTVTRPFSWEPELRRMGAHHDVIVVEVLDPRELELPDVGPVVLVDPETGHRCDVWTSLPGVRDRYARTAAEHRNQVAAAVRAAGASHVVLRTDRDWVTDLARQVQRRHGSRQIRRRNR